MKPPQRRLGELHARLTRDHLGEFPRCTRQGKGHVNLPKDLCLRIKGGHLAPKAGEEG